MSKRSGIAERVAVATFDGTTLLTHGGRARRFDVYDTSGAAAGESVPTLVGCIELVEEEVLHLCGDGRPHPIDQVGAVIAGASGDGFVKHMGRRGIEAVITDEEDVAKALADYVAGTVRPADPPPHPHEHRDPETGETDGGHHHHDHDHRGQGHGHDRGAES